MKQHQPLYGVNLGGWLVLERWMTPSLFAGSDAADEFSLCSTASPAIDQRIIRHRDTFITARDFTWLARQGVQAVRLPVGYWAWGDVPPYQQTITYVDKAMRWAEAASLQVLLCLHGAPGSQNGRDHSGRSGEVAWGTLDTVLASEQCITTLARRYAGRPGLLGIELLNEPDASIPRHVLNQYYRRMCRRIRQICGPDTWVVFSDAFQLGYWQWRLHWPWRRAYMDTHQYQCFTAADKVLNGPAHLRKTAAVGRLLRAIGWHRRLIVGEWSAALDQQSLPGCDNAQANAAKAAYAQAQMQAYRHADAWFFWSYTTESSDPSWNFTEAVRHGWLKIPKNGNL